jgi:hypothetical protein
MMGKGKEGEILKLELGIVRWELGNSFFHFGRRWSVVGRLFSFAHSTNYIVTFAS